MDMEQKNCFEMFHAYMLHYLPHVESVKKPPSYETRQIC
jgi:hypothetical protein